VQDHLRGIAQVVDALGNVVERYEYDPYGKMSVLTGSWAANGTVPTVPGQVYGFTGRQVDPETGLMYYRHRYYQPGHGRFLTQDPVGLWVDARAIGNSYAYCASKPADWADPQGLWSPPGHHSLLDSSLGNVLSPATIAKMKWLNDKFDNETQDELHKHAMHATMDSFMTPIRDIVSEKLLAAKRRDDFICSSLLLARQAADAGNVDGAYEHFVAAWHTYSDWTCQVHVYPDGTPRGIQFCVADYWAHIPGWFGFLGSENPEDITEQARERNRSWLRAHLNYVFGGGRYSAGFPEPTPLPPPPPPPPPSPFSRIEAHHKI
jgi:RHS repeat-associated protein